MSLLAMQVSISVKCDVEEQLRLIGDFATSHVVKQIMKLCVCVCVLQALLLSFIMQMLQQWMC